MRSVRIDICTSVEPVSLSCFLDSTTDAAFEKVGKSISFPRLRVVSLTGHAHFVHGRYLPTCLVAFMSL